MGPRVRRVRKVSLEAGGGAPEERVGGPEPKTQCRGLDPERSLRAGAETKTETQTQC